MPRPRRQTRGLHRRVGFEDRRQAGRFQHPENRGGDGGKPEAAAEALGGRVPAHQRADPGAVDRGDAGEIDDQLALAAAEDLLNVLLERLGGAARDERLLRREHKAGRDGS